MELYLVDVFAERKYAGNQLAVVRNAASLSTEKMQQIAKEMNYSETTFILSDKSKNGGYDVRIFTPAGEVPFAGHPTLGTAYIIQQEIIGQPVPEITLNLGVGQIPVSISYAAGQPDELWMHQKPPEFGLDFEPEIVADALSISPADIEIGFPIQDVSTGLPFIIVPLQNLDAVKRCQIKADRYADLISNSLAKSVLVFSVETYHAQNDLNVRMFSPYYNVPEDPATGSANGCLAGYLVKYKYFGSDKIDLRAEQGYEIGRPSLLLLRAQVKADDHIDVFVGGNVIPVARGELI